MNKKKVLILLTPLLLVGCSSNSEEQKQQNPKEEDNPVEPGRDPYSSTVILSGSTFAEKFPGNGVNFGAGYSNKNNQLFTFISNQLENEYSLTNLSLESCSTRIYDNVSYFQISTGNLAENVGSFTWTSAVNITKVKITCLNYANPYKDYQTQEMVPNVEQNGKLLVDSQQFTLQLKDDGFPKETEITVTYESGVKSFSLSAIDGRIFISKLEIDWRP